MQCSIHIEVPANWVSVKGSKKNTVKFLWCDLKACVRIVAMDMLTENEQAVFNSKKGMSKCSTKHMMDLEINHGLRCN